MNTKKRPLPAGAQGLPPARVEIASRQADQGFLVTGIRTLLLVLVPNGMHEDRNCSCKLQYVGCVLTSNQPSYGRACDSQLVTGL